MSRRAASLLVLVVSLGVLGGCASRTWRMEGVGPNGELGREVRYVLESDAGNEGSVTVAARGRARDQIDGRSTDTLRVWMTLDNASDDPISVPSERLIAKDDQGRQLVRLSALAPGPPASDIVIGPRQRATVELLYDLGAPNALPSTGSLTIDWTYRFRGKEIGHSTRFLPVRYYAAPPAYQVGFGYGYGPGFGPWSWGGGGFYSSYCW